MKKTFFINKIGVVFHSFLKNIKKTRLLRGEFLLHFVDERRYTRQRQIASSHLDFYVNATGQFQLHQSVDGLGGCTVNVQQSLVSGEFELLS